MNFVKDILDKKDRPIVAVQPSVTVFEALRVMAENNIGSVVVLENGNLLGIFTERDYSRKIILKGKNSATTIVSEIMTTELPRLRPDDTIEECKILMNKGNLRYVPVFDGEELKGIISISDVIRETILIQQQTIDDLNNYIHS